MEIHDYHIEEWLEYNIENKKFPSHMENIRFQNVIDYDWYFKITIYYDTSLNKNIILELTPERKEIEIFVREQKINEILNEDINIEEIPKHVFQSILDYRYESGLWTEEYYYINHSKSDVKNMIHVHVKLKDPTKQFRTHPAGQPFTMPEETTVIFEFDDIYKTSWYKRKFKIKKLLDDEN